MVVWHCLMYMVDIGCWWKEKRHVYVLFLRKAHSTEQPSRGCPHLVLISGTHSAKSTEATSIKCLAQGHNILMLGFEPSPSVSRSRHSNQITNILHNRELSSTIEHHCAGRYVATFHCDFIVYRILPAVRGTRR